MLLLRGLCCPPDAAGFGVRAELGHSGGQIIRVVLSFLHVNAFRGGEVLTLVFTTKKVWNSVSGAWVCQFSPHLQSLVVSAAGWGTPGGRILPQQPSSLALPKLTGRTENPVNLGAFFIATLSANFKLRILYYF